MPIVIENSADESQISLQCMGDVVKEVENDLRAMGYGRWRELCAIEMRARERTKVDSGIIVDVPVPESDKELR